MQGLNRRLGALPIAPLTPLVARISASLYRCAIGLAVALICGYVIGFRFHRGPLYITAFCLLVLLTGVALAFLGDVIGTNSRNPAATTQWLLLPQLIFGYLSVGLQPLHRFPEWIQPMVRDQPVSQLVYALQALAGDTAPGAVSVTWSVVGPALAWVVGHHRADPAVGDRGLPAEKLMAVLVGAARAAYAEAYSENSLRHLLSHTRVLTRRLLVRLVRNPMTIVHALVLPVGFLLALDVVLGDSVTAATGEDGCTAACHWWRCSRRCQGSTAGMVGITGEQSRRVPGPVVGAADASCRRPVVPAGSPKSCRLVATTLVILGTGIILGLRFHQGLAAALLWLVVPVIFGVAFSAMVTMAALYWPKAVLVEAVQVLAWSGPSSVPGSFRWTSTRTGCSRVVRYQPMSAAVDAMRGLSVGGPVLLPILGTLAWSVRDLFGVPVADHGGLPQGQHQPVDPARHREGDMERKSSRCSAHRQSAI